MIVFMRRAALLALLLVAGNGQRALAQEPPMTLWRFLGIPQAHHTLHAKIFNRHGHHPHLEPKPPILPLADPANLESGIPALEAAAEIKMAEDLAPQKIKAIRYLASIGCGCYDKGGKVTDALLAATDDCTESVRLAAVQAISETAQGQNCEQCGQRGCCNPKIVEQLAVMAYERDEFGGWVEPSQRVRQAALQALAVCCPDRGPVIIVAPEPDVVPDIEPLEPDVIEPLERIEELEDDPVLPPLPPTSRRESHYTDGRFMPVSVAGSRGLEHGEPGHLAPVMTPVCGEVRSVNFFNGDVQVRLHSQYVLHAGTKLGVFQRLAGGTDQVVAEIEVVEAGPGQLVGRVVDRRMLANVTRGAAVTGWHNTSN
jgi:hypothetical protein